ncbi:hypothetical protein EMPS_00997 [Entomortierella parvispora]|uniref:FAD-binding domain-containing protein n=1 Tax=Entomortierella parvispora TaxID=205924 RepID=A0A9P3LS44_9FUNG|nr:hypothetical protein EMPS_00997 [Entomortierella parvispora]
MNPHHSHEPANEFDDTPTKYPSQLPPRSDGKNPNVMIVGAGLAGLLLAILLDKAGIPYEIYERSSTVRPLGSILSLNAKILGAIEQIGLLDELKAISLPAGDSNIMYENMKVIATFNNNSTNSEVGYDYLNFPRPEFHQLLLSKVPVEKIHYNKKVMSMMQNKEGVMIRCADGTTYHGDILVGADGAHSAVRQGLYKALQEQSLLPASDATELSKGFLALVGTTDPLDPEQYPFLKNKTSNFSQVIGRGTSFSWSEFNMPENRICWVIISQIGSAEEFEKIKFRNSEWGPESNSEFIDQVKDFKVPGGGTLGNLINATPEANISRVFLEEKLFETWSHGRTVLIGDAAHKLLPSAGQGAVCALQDAVILANCLYDLESLDRDAIHAACLDYKEQRYPHLAVMYEKSNLLATILHGQTLTERVVRHVILNWVPESFKLKEIRKGAAYRPMVAFLPPIPKRGTIDLLPQKPSRRYEREQKKKREEEVLKNQIMTESVSSAIATPVVSV